jgi:hypothetical protein
MPATKFHYFVDDVKYEFDQSSITGAQIKSRIPNFNPSYQLFLEKHGNEPDQLIADTDAISLDPAGGVKKFFTAPPATFGQHHGR